MENIGKVLDLDKKITNGFSTLASIAIDENKCDVTLMDVMVFSNKEDIFIKQDELKAYENGKIEDKSREAKIKALVDEEKHINMTLSLIRQSKTVSDTMKG